MFVGRGEWGDTSPDGGKDLGRDGGASGRSIGVAEAMYVLRGGLAGAGLLVTESRREGQEGESRAQSELAVWMFWRWFR